MQPEYLQKGDAIAIVAPAKQIESEFIEYAVKIIEENGFKPLISNHCLGKNDYFSGTIAERTEDLQWALNNNEVKAILCARGGFGSIQILERVNWAGFLTEPKWMIGFSDVTVFHQYLSKIKTSSLHGTMPLNFKENTTESLTTLFDTLQGKLPDYTWNSEYKNQTGEAEGALIGGNLTVLSGIIGTKQMPNYEDRILFLEDIGEPLYAIDRMFYQLEYAGILSKIKGLIIGDFGNVKDSTPPYGKSLQSIIKAHFKYNAIPIAFDFPAGHCNDNQALVLGKKATLMVSENNASLTYLKG